MGLFVCFDIFWRGGDGGGGGKGVYLQLMKRLLAANDEKSEEGRRNVRAVR